MAHCELRVREASLRASHLQEQVQASMARVAERTVRNAHRKENIARLRVHIHDMEAKRAEGPVELSKAMLAYQMVAESLVAQQQQAVELLHRLFPLRVNGVRPNTGQPLQVRTHLRECLSQLK